jgi:hypothetical protein
VGKGKGGQRVRGEGEKGQRDWGGEGTQFATLQGQFIGVLFFKFLLNFAYSYLFLLILTYAYLFLFIFTYFYLFLLIFTLSGG